MEISNDQMFACDICFERLSAEGRKMPMTLPCMHSFCSDCVCRLHTLKCPTCRKDFASIAILLPNYALISQIQLFAQTPGNMSDLSTPKLEEMLRSRKLEEAHRKQIEQKQRLEDFARGGSAEVAYVVYVAERRLLEQMQAALEARIVAAAEEIRQEGQPALTALRATVRKSLLATVWHRERAASEEACSWLLDFWASGAPSSDYEMMIGKKLFSAKYLQDYSMATMDCVSLSFTYIRTFNVYEDDIAMYRAVYVGVIDSLLTSVCYQKSDDWDNAVEATARARLSAFFSLLASSPAIHNFPAIKAKLAEIEADLQTKCTGFCDKGCDKTPSTFLYAMDKKDCSVDAALDLAMRWLALYKADEDEMDRAGVAAGAADSSEEDDLVPGVVVARALSRLVIPAAAAGRCSALAVDVVLWRVSEDDDPARLRRLRQGNPAASAVGMPDSPEGSSIVVNLLLRGNTYCLMYPTLV